MLLCTCEREREQESDMALQATTADTSCCHSNRLLKFLFILDGGVRLNTPVCAFPPTLKCVTRLHLNRVDVASRLHTETDSSPAETAASPKYTELNKLNHSWLGMSELSLQETDV